MKKCVDGVNYAEDMEFKEREQQREFWQKRLENMGLIKKYMKK